mgnify:CR=1 FL=1
MEAIRAFCERHHIQRMALFGSVLRDDFRSGGDDPSDIDVLVEFEPGHTPGWAYYTWGEELAALIARKVDLLTREELSRQYRDRVLDDMIVIYERTR